MVSKQIDIMRLLEQRKFSKQAKSDEIDDIKKFIWHKYLQLVGNVHRKFGVNWLNIKDVVPNLRCKG